MTNVKTAMASNDILPADYQQACLIGRVWEPEKAGPTPVLLRQDTLFDISSLAPTVSELMELDDLPAKLSGSFNPVCTLDAALKNSLHFQHDSKQPSLLSPIDLQAIKASGVTFAASMLERVIEERAAGDLNRAESLRKEITDVIGNELSAIKPGSDSAMKLKTVLIEKGVWSQYLEVGIGPFAEIFSKSQPMSSLGLGAELGLHPASEWNNPEPEVVLVVNSKAQIRGATLGNDVNLRDIEGRSALLLGKAKDNNGSCALGPFIRLFDEQFSLADIKSADIALKVEGEDGFVMQGLSSMSKISRSPEDLVAQTIGDFHQYPDGLVLFLGTMFAPVDERGEAGKGFSHKPGDKVSISSGKLGTLVNWMNRSDAIPAWTFGTRALIKNLAARGLL